MATNHQRLLLAEGMDYLVSQEPRVHYGQVRPIPYANLFVKLQAFVERAGGLTTDCSGSVTLLSNVAGLKNPNGGFPYIEGRGNTQMMYDYLSRYTKAAGANVGALCFFGVPGELATQHVTMVRHPGANPVLFSHGQERGPLYVPFSVELAYHQKAHPGGIHVFLSIAKL